MATSTPTRGQRVNGDVTALLKARHTLLWVVTREEARVERALIESAGAAKYEVRFWDCASGITASDASSIDNGLQDPRAALEYAKADRTRCVLVMRDLHRWLDPVVLRTLRNLARDLQSAPAASARSIVVLSPSGDVPPELAGHTTVIEYPLPDRAEVAAILDDVVASLPDALRAGAAPNGTREQAIDAAVGLTAEEAANCYARSIVSARTIDPALVASEKRRVIAREKVLSWIDPDPRGLEAVGGLDLLKVWLAARRRGFSARARAFGLPAPKGVLLVGVPGCGKSLAAKCVAAAWKMPLLRLDLGALRSKYVGESEGNIRKALAVAEAVSPCVLWLDEIEKALAGSTGPQVDGGVAADALGSILSWMQERAGAVFVIATANDVRSLPPELLRKGRFDEVFWVDLPTADERAAVIASALRQHGRDPSAVDLVAVAARAEGFTGAELAAIVPDALFAAFADGERDITTDDLVTAAATVVPLSKTAADKINELRGWARGRARPASEQKQQTKGAGHALDV
jgi:hypothetical protein